ncbi:MAG: hypothetical protein K2Z80_03755 [Xanthobacteraceae bacterium]|nr:hypothetical protein [Xanthobacteraceae bacterium]
MTIRERALRAIGALAGFGPLTQIGAGHERVNARLQRAMDARPLARASDPSTSHEVAAQPSDAKRREEPARPLQSARAGRSLRSPARAARIASTISDTQRLVLDFIRSHGASGCTDLDIQRRFGDHGSTYRTRRAELTVLGRVRDSGVRVTQDGGRRIVWVAVEHHRR